MSAPERDFNVLIRLAQQGDQKAEEELYRLLEEELKRIARARLSLEPPGHALQTEVLVNDTFLILVRDQKIQWENRAQFCHYATRKMRHILVDAARKRKAKKRQPAEPPSNGESRDPLDDLVLREDLEALDKALTKLARHYPVHSQIVELHHFGARPFKEIAEILHESLSTIKRRWKFAQAWLQRAIEGSNYAD